MSFTFDPYRLAKDDVTKASDVLMTNPTALQELEGYWKSLPKRLGVPKRTDVNPTAMGTLLEDCFILERVAPGVARIRVAGRNIGKLIGAEPRGLPMTSLVLPNARPALAGYLEMSFNGPSVIELTLEAPRAIGQPKLDGKMLLLPLRDDHGRVSRILGALVMSGRRGQGARRFTIVETSKPRIDPIVGLRAVGPDDVVKKRPSLLHSVSGDGTQKAKGTRALRLVVSNP